MKVINLVFICKLLRIVVSTSLNRQLSPQFLRSYDPDIQILPQEFYESAYICAWVPTGIHSLFLDNLSYARCYVKNMTILLTIHNYIIRWTILVIMMTTSKITCQ